jgi:arginine N-succinyltransferase
MIRYEIRAARREDEAEFLRLAQYLNTVNLPNSAEHIRRLLDDSEKSFTQQLEPRHRRYVFVLYDLQNDCAVGTSTIVAQLGRRDAPYIYLDVLEEEKYSRTLDKHFYHTLLRLGFSYDGPTELAGLVVDPRYRGASERLGLLISYVRFLYIAAHRELFQDELLAELLPPLEPDGTSHLGEALGRHFTGLSYAEADLLSSENKDFIRDLFPNGVIYASLFSPEAQSVIGKVGAQTRGVEKMLVRVGFRYAQRIDPFDGGPHFVAPTDEVSLVARTLRLRCKPEATAITGKKRGLLAKDLGVAPYLRAVVTDFELQPGGEVRVPAPVAAHLQAAPGDELICLPLP